jgi:hypothetical protein
MIVAVAIRCGAKLASLNTGDFQPLVSYGLILAWEEQGPPTREPFNQLPS